ncbi:MAG: ABC transporter ATP-binding protein [Anaerovoracaceae bacterium]|jgi:putative ABC transport system ATP-binding protein|nr:ABC transporter ATP-binding protein [Anaerovoracaceae bacterium]
MNTIISTKDLSYGPVIISPDVSISKNETTFLYGPSGCGKTTLTRLMNATLSPEQGELFYNEVPYSDLEVLALRKDIILVSQAIYLFDGTIKENFIKFYEYREETIPTEDAMREYLQLCCADFPLDSSCEILSGGERHRIYIAICLSFLPKVIILDEPTSALDSRTANRLLKNLKSFTSQKEITQIIISHDISLVEQFGDKIISCFQGCSQEVNYE